MLKVPSVFHIDDITEKIIKEKAAPTGETAVINYRDWKTIQLGYLVNISKSHLCIYLISCINYFLVTK